jgi:NCS1 family nucleobase:cation symporter-1
MLDNRAIKTNISRLFLSAITGIMLCQYFMISRGHLVIPDLYNTSRDGMYWYSGGWNYRAYVAYILGIAPNFYGFLGVFGVNITVAASRLYYFAYPIGLVISFLVYWGLCYLDPPKCMTTREWKEPVNYIAPDDDSVAEGIEVEASSVEEGKASPEMQGAKM